MSRKTNDSISLREFFDEYYRPRRLLDGSIHTVHRYENAFRHFHRFLGREPMVSDLDETTMTALIKHHSQGRAAHTVVTLRNKLMALANYAHKKGLLAEVPDVPRIRVPQRLPVAFTVNEISRLVEAARQVSGERCLIPAGKFWSALFLVAYDTGARAGAIWSLEWTDYRPDTLALLFRAEKQKQRCDQLLRVSQQTADALGAIQGIYSQRMIFPWDRAECQKSYHIKTILATAGLPHGRHDQLQRIRKTTASIMHALGADATAQLGHSTDTVTRKYYLDTVNAQQACDVLPRPGTTETKARTTEDSLSFSVCVGMEGRVAI